MGCAPGEPIKGTRIDVAFVGSCTNARLSDLREAARVVEGRHVAPHVRALVGAGSQSVRLAAEREGLDRIFIDAGFDWRGAGCSMCLAMNPDQLEGREICASSSNRNFKGRQGSPTGRTLLMSPAMVAAAAVAGEVVDVREFARAWPLRGFGEISGRGAAAARRQHRHRSDHPGAIPARRSRSRGSSSTCSRTIGIRPTRRRRRRIRSRTRATRARDPARERQLRLRLVARARAAGDPPARASAPSSASRSPRSSSATPSRSACRALSASHADMERLMALVERAPATVLALDLAGETRVRRRCHRCRHAAAGGPRVVSRRHVGRDRPAAGSLRRGRSRGGAAAVHALGWRCSARERRRAPGYTPSARARP